MSIFGGGGGGGGGGSTTGTQTSIAREAPGVEARKLSLYDEAANLAKNPVSLPGIQVAPLSALEQSGITQAGQTGVGSGAVTSGISSLMGAPGTATQAQGLANLYGTGATQSGVAAAQTAAAGPNINQFLNPYQQYVTNEIGRQGQIAQNQLSASAINAGAFGGGRQGVQQAELQNRTLQAMGQAQAQGFQTALGAAQNQQQLGTQTQLAAGQLGLQAGQLGLQGGQLASNVGLQAGQSLGQLGGQQQAMSLADINAQMQAGGVQRGVGQQALEAQRQTQLQRAYEPYQRVEFLKGIMTNLPTTQSSVTATTAPGSNPLAQAAGTGLGAYAAYNMMQPR